MRLVSWNVNSIRARLDHLGSVFDRWSPDVVLLQETRCPDAAFPVEVFEDRGYCVVHHGPDHRNGVAIASRVGLDEVRVGFAPPSTLDSARLLSAVCAGVRVHSIYVPNGRTLDHPEYRHKLEWLAALRVLVAEDLRAGIPSLLAGDFNVAPADVDIYDPSRFRRTTHASPPERSAIRALEEAGLTDVMRARDPSPGLYTWWSYRPGQLERNRGLRIDLVFVDEALRDRVVEVRIDRETRALPKASDHAPVVVDLFPRFPHSPHSPHFPHFPHFPSETVRAGDAAMHQSEHAREHPGLRGRRPPGTPRPSARRGAPRPDEGNRSCTDEAPSPRPRTYELISPRAADRPSRAPVRACYANPWP